MTICFHKVFCKPLACKGGKMKAYIKERTLEIAKHIKETEDTIRATAKIYNLSKSTVHNDLSKRLKYYDTIKYNLINLVFLKQLNISW